MKRAFRNEIDLPTERPAQGKRKIDRSISSGSDGIDDDVDVALRRGLSASDRTEDANVLGTVSTSKPQDAGSMRCNDLLDTESRAVGRDPKLRQPEVRGLASGLEADVTPTGRPHVAAPAAMDPVLPPRLQGK